MNTTIEYNIKIRSRSENIAAIEIDNIDENCIIAAYGDRNIPSLILQNQETKEFSHIKFKDFEKFTVWAADLNGDSLKICLVK